MTAQQWKGLMYLAGPIGECADAEDFARILERAHFASQVQGKLLMQGWACVNPYGSCDSLANFALPYEYWIEAGCLAVRACTAICMLPGWRGSNGAQVELKVAQRHGLGCYEWVEGKLVELAA